MTLLIKEPLRIQLPIKSFFSSRTMSCIDYNLKWVHSSFVTASFDRIEMPQSQQVSQHKDCVHSRTSLLGRGYVGEDD